MEKIAFDADMNIADMVDDSVDRGQAGNDLIIPTKIKERNNLDISNPEMQQMPKKRHTDFLSTFHPTRGGSDILICGSQIIRGMAAAK